MLALKSIFFTLLLPGTVTVLVPYLVITNRLSGDPQAGNFIRYFGALPMAIGFAILLKCVWDFAAVGRGTLAPVDPPKTLVVRGLYRFVRNPMYVGVILALSGEALWFLSWELVLFALLFFGLVHSFVVFYEEPTLRRQFGESYHRYCRSVNRWLPTWPLVLSKPNSEEREQSHAAYRQGGEQRAGPPQVVYQDADCPHGCGQRLQAIDFRLEDHGKDVHNPLVRAWWDDTGFVGRCPKCRQWIHLTIRGKRAITEDEATALPKLPDDWSAKATIR
jgi:protein-S-isoprenylcysteine O-methyltransferase Ste14